METGLNHERLRHRSRATMSLDGVLSVMTGTKHKRNRYRFTPLYDVNPQIERTKVVKTEIARGSGEAATIEALIDEPQDFGMKPALAREIVRDMAANVAARWRAVAADVGLSSRQIAELAPAFDHGEAHKALRLSDGPEPLRPVPGIGD
jgi:hypothetical protein